jgi:hypothetical protein
MGIKCFDNYYFLRAVCVQCSKSVCFVIRCFYFFGKHFFG